ncbi:carboxylesterase family protein-like protein [Exophiala viscosa]|uniref:Carboxylic ester hydrolase n=1 Tax=Exophiala viscosa TaxID=2486360 RepID=A0AAN6DQG9_9EURO|nr:carboxylesterase family protein-like protein [Exophiala viscosa]
MEPLDNNEVGKDFPQVDLGYSVYQASGYDEAGDFFTFNNIRYAAPPTGARRFQTPEPPLVNRDVVQTGLSGNFPPQAVPLWRRVIKEWPNPGSEDCLFLDVKVPRATWDGRDTQVKGVPVMVWIFGGGYTAGSKEAFGSGAGLLARSAEPIIYVALNYRLGIYGFLAGPKYTGHGGTANLGLLDQRFALQWIQKHISAFGGDPDRVTVIGESAGGGSIYHQVTAYGGQQGQSPFAQAILQSPGFYPITDSEVMDRHYQSALTYANCDCVDDLKLLSEAKLKEVNLAVIDEAPYGQFLLGPVVDGVFAPNLPGTLLSSGSFDHGLRIMLGQCYNEGGDYVEPVDISPSYFSEYLDRTFPSMKPSVKDYVTSNLYPSISTILPDFQRSSGLWPHFSHETPYYTTPTARLQRLIGDAIYIQHNNALSTAFQNKTYNYMMSLAPGTHGTDISYTFYNEGKEEKSAVPGLPNVKNRELAHIFQKYLTNFVLYGDPNGNKDAGLPKMNQRGDDFVVLNFGENGIEEIRDPSAKEQCLWWQKGLFA